MRYLCIDLGDQRTGLAVGDDLTGLVSPLRTLEVPIGHDDGRRLLDAVGRAVIDQLGPASSVSLPGELVVGLPMNMDGTEGPRARKARDFVAKLVERIGGRPIHFQDERLSTVAADWEMARSGLTRGQKKERRDGLAAASVLRDFLAGRANPGPPDQEPAA
ncbi:MAG: Holliday junction resolvase RuvX [Phycisphaerales bacterium]|nr:Holliday junction resolvase RuvX [Phycisphaerales bacterium]